VLVVGKHNMKSLRHGHVTEIPVNKNVHNAQEVHERIQVWIIATVPFREIAFSSTPYAKCGLAQGHPVQYIRVALKGINPWGIKLIPGHFSGYGLNQLGQQMKPGFRKPV
jgi:hypothetical protein